MSDTIETVDIGGTEVELRKTDDGFEAVEANTGPESNEDVVYIRGEDSCANYGFEVPVGSVVLEYRGSGYFANWDDNVDVSDMSSNGNSGAKDIGPDEYDGYAYVENVELVE